MGRQLRFLLLGLGLTYYFNPLYVRSGAFSFARSIHGYVDLSPIEDPDSLQVNRRWEMIKGCMNAHIEWATFDVALFQGLMR